MKREDDSPVYYFAYGSCMDNARFKQAGSTTFAEPVGGAVVEGYSTRFTLRRPDGSRADLVEDGGELKACCTSSRLKRQPICTKRRC